MQARQSLGVATTSSHPSGADHNEGKRNRTPRLRHHTCTDGDVPVSEEALPHRGRSRASARSQDTSHVCCGVGGDAREGDDYNRWCFKKRRKACPPARIIVHALHSIHSNLPRACPSQYIQPKLSRVMSCLQQLQTGGSAWYRIASFCVSIY